MFRRSLPEFSRTLLVVLIACSLVVTPVIAAGDSLTTANDPYGEPSKNARPSHDHDERIQTQITADGPDRPLEYASTLIQPDPNSTVIVPDGEYTFTVTTQVENKDLTEFLEKSAISDPWVEFTVSASGSGSQPTITGVASKTSDYNVTKGALSAQTYRVSADKFGEGSIHRALVRVRVPPGTDSLSFDAQIGRGTSDSELTASRSYDVVSRGTTPTKLATLATARAHQAAQLNRTYDSILDYRSVSGIIDRGLSKTLVTIGKYGAGELLLPPPAGQVVNAVKFGNYLQDLASEADGPDQTYGPWFGAAARAQMQMIKNGFTTIELNTVERAGNASYILRRIHRLATAEARAWRNNNRKKAIRKLRKQREYLTQTNTSDLLVAFPDALADPSDLPTGAYEAGFPGGSFNLYEEAADQKREAAEGSSTDFATDQSFENAEQYLDGVLGFAQSTASHVGDLLSTVRRPDPRIELENPDSVRASLATTGTFTARFNVSNTGGITSHQGYISLVYSADTLNITGIRKVAADSDDDTAPRTNTITGADGVITSGGDREDINGTLTDIYEQFAPGEANVYAITFDRTGDPGNPAYLTYRAAFQPAIHNGTGQSTFVREPTLDTSNTKRGQQGWAVHNVSYAGVGTIDRSRVDGDADGDAAYASIQTAIDNATAGTRIVVAPGTYRERLTVEKNVTLVAPSGATLNGSSFSGAAAVTIPGSSDAAAVVSGFTITGYETGIAAGGTPQVADSSGSSGNWTVANTTIRRASWYAVDASQTTGNWTLRNVRIRRSGGVNALDATGAWRITTSDVSATSTYAVQASETTGNWQISDTRLVGDSGLAASSSSGDWTVRYSRISGGVTADSTDGDWKITRSVIANAVRGIFAKRSGGAWGVHESSFVDISGFDISAAFAHPEGDATRNWWGIDGTECAYGTDCSNPLSTPPTSGPRSGPGVGGPPTAGIDVTAREIATDETVIFNGSGTTDPDADTLLYEWDFDGDESVDETGKTVTHSYPSAGNYTATLTVTDPTNRTDTAQVDLSVKHPVLLAIRNVSVNESRVVLGEPIRITATITNEGLNQSDYEFYPLFDGRIPGKFALTSNRESGTISPGETVYLEFNYTFTTPRTVNITVADFARETTESPTAVVSADAKPTVGIDRNRTYIVAGDGVRISAAASSDADGLVRAYRWDLGRDGDIDHRGPAFTRTFSEPGVYTYELELEDDEGYVTTVKREVAVYGPQDWPTGSFYARRTGSSSHVTGPQRDVHVEWRGATTGGGIAILDGRAYAYADGNLTAYDATTGVQEWSRSTPSGKPVAWGNTVLVTGKTTAVAVNATTGMVRWRRDLPRVGSLERGQPAVLGGTAYLPRGLAIDIRTGDTVWTTPWEANALAATSQRIYMPFDDGVRAFDPSNGSIVWETTVSKATNGIAPTVANGSVFVGDQNITALNATTGQVQWTRELGQNTSQVVSPAYASGTLYYSTKNVSEGIGGRLYAVNATTGRTMWTAEYPSWGQSPPVVADGIVYVASDACEISCSNEFVYPDGKIWAFDSESGAVEWTHRTDESIHTAPAISNGYLYISDGWGTLLALDANQSDSDRSDSPSFSLRVVGSNSPVTTGNALNLTVNVTNPGTTTDTQSVSLRINGSRMDSRSVELDAGNSKTIHLTWATGGGDVGEYTATIRTGDGSAVNTTVRVREPAPEKPPSGLDSDLYGLVQANNRSAFASKHGLRVNNSRVVAVIELVNTTDIPAGYGVTITSQYGTQVQAWIPIGKLVALSEEGRVRLVRRPTRLQPH